MFIISLLTKDVVKRAGTANGAQDLKENPFFRGLDWALMEVQQVVTILSCRRDHRHHCHHVQSSPITIPTPHTPRTDSASAGAQRHLSVREETISKSSSLFALESKHNLINRKKQTYALAPLTTCLIHDCITRPCIYLRFLQNECEATLES